MITAIATKSFIETQFPVSKLSKESYKERRACAGQTLPGIGKWWGRKPLILVRAAILGILFPTSNNPAKDREIFLKILAMDEDGLWRRKSKSIPLTELYARLTVCEREQWFELNTDESRPRYKKEVSRGQREALQRLVFTRLSYDQRLMYCDRPEQLDSLSEAAWADINAHIGTTAHSLPELVRQLGERQFGHVPRVGDAFCGGGSVSFEAARMGCNAYGSDLSPVATLLTWAALHIIGGGPEVATQVRLAQQAIYEAVDRQITAWGIEHNDRGWRAYAYLYCNEVVCPECRWRVPLAPSWVISEKTRCIARLQPDEAQKRFDILIESDVSPRDMDAAKKAATVKKSSLVCPHCHQTTPMTMLRGDRRTAGSIAYGLRLWENDDLVSRPGDVFQERLYCIRWVETVTRPDGTTATLRHYRAPDAHDLQREATVLRLLRERFHAWQAWGYLPSRRIEPGYNTDQPIRERGWTHWHQLFNPRQLLVEGLLAKELSTHTYPTTAVACLLGLGKCLDRGSKLCVWDSSLDVVANTFLNQSLNTLTNYGVRTILTHITSWDLDIAPETACGKISTTSGDARNIRVWLNLCSGELRE